MPPTPTSSTRTTGWPRSPLSGRARRERRAWPTPSPPATPRSTRSTARPRFTGRLARHEDHRDRGRALQAAARPALSCGLGPRSPRALRCHAGSGAHRRGRHGLRFWRHDGWVRPLRGTLCRQGSAPDRQACPDAGDDRVPRRPVRAAREAAGDELSIMADLNQWWRMPGDISVALDLAAVRRIADELRELGVLWLEEPLPAADLGGMRTLREQTGIRVAGGEMARTPAELLGALAAGALDVVQPDPVLAIGLLRARTVGEVAMLANRWFTPHAWTNGLGLLASLHLAAGVGGGPFLEFPYDPPGWTPPRRDFFLAEPLMIDASGCLEIGRAHV